MGIFSYNLSKKLNVKLEEKQYCSQLSTLTQKD